MKRVRLLSFNIHGCCTLSGRSDAGRVHDLMERLDIDIGVFQEMETRASRKGSSTHMKLLTGASRPHHLAGPSLMEGEQWFGNLIVSRHPIIRGLVHHLGSGIGFEPRNAVDALIKTPHGNLRVVGTHLSLSYLERRSEARNLMRLVREAGKDEKNPLLVMGDINEWQWRSRLLRYLDEEMTPLPCKGTFPVFLPLLKLDRAWYDTPRTMKVYAYRLAGSGIRTLSDHLPLVVEVDYPVSNRLP